MGKAEPPKPVKLFVGLLTSRPAVVPGVLKSLEERLGPVDYSSDFMEFKFTRYYETEMGPGLKRKFLSFGRLVLPGELAGIKLFTNGLEERWSEDGKRLVNLDPGYLNQARVVLASTKDFSHRIYIGEGIYAEVTLMFRRKRFDALPWTYPDFQSPAYQEVFLHIRERYSEQIDLYPLFPTGPNVSPPFSKGD